MAATIFDENIVCPVTGEVLKVADGDLIAANAGRRYAFKDEIPLLFVEEAGTQATAADSADRVTQAVQGFYEDAPFPNYNSFDKLATFVERANQGVFARLLREQIPMNANVLEVGCGTGQLSNFLAATTVSRVYATDMTLPSLQLGRGFADRNGIHGVRFVQMNLFAPAIRPESMDIVITNGVLHHTHDTRKAFERVSRLVKPGGCIVVGLYNHIGRLRTDFRRVLVKVFGERVLFLDPHLRSEMSPEKRRAWIRDQYHHPQERKHSISEVIEWFDAAGFSFVSSIPKIVGTFAGNERLFESRSRGTSFDRYAAEIGMLFSHFGGEGGLFICIGRRNHGTTAASGATRPVSSDHR